MQSFSKNILFYSSTYIYVFCIISYNTYYTVYIYVLSIYFSGSNVPNSIILTPLYIYYYSTFKPYYYYNLIISYLTCLLAFSVFTPSNKFKVFFSSQFSSSLVNYYILSFYSYTFNNLYTLYYYSTILLILFSYYIYSSN